LVFVPHVAKLTGFGKSTAFGQILPGYGVPYAWPEMIDQPVDARWDWHCFCAVALELLADVNLPEKFDLAAVTRLVSGKKYCNFFLLFLRHAETINGDVIVELLRAISNQ
jgi:hypothetical protein